MVVRGPITKINQSDYFISGPVRADIFPVSDRVLSRMIPRDSTQDFCLLNQDGGKYERYFFAEITAKLRADLAFFFL